MCEELFVGLCICSSAIALGLVAFLIMCLRHCWSPRGYRQEMYWSHFLSQEKKVFQYTMVSYAHIQPIQHVHSFFGFVALEDDEKELLKSAVDSKARIPSLEWNRITGVCPYRENEGTPFYSHLHKGFWFNRNMQAMEKES